MPSHGPDVTAGTLLKYGVYTSVLQDDTLFWNMGGNGLLPYGTPRPPPNGPPDLVDMIQMSRQQGDGPCAPSPDAAPGTVVSDGAAPAVTPPAEKRDEKADDMGGKESKEAPPDTTPSAEKSGTPE
jgi:hypothetical protein